MIIVVEGADCAGKSTWVERLHRSLSSYYDTRVLHAGPPSDADILDQYLAPLELALLPNVALILDRWHPGELVYGPLRRSGSRLSRGQFAYIEAVMRSIGYAGCLCDRPTADLLACYDVRGDDVAERAQLALEADSFRDILAPRKDWHVIDTTGLQDEHAWTQAELAIIKTVSPLAPFVIAPVKGAYVGARFPSVLLVGDRRNPRDKHTPLPWPFVPWTNTSGHWMFQALVENDVPMERLGVINACEREPAELRAAWLALGQPRVVALGANARHALNEAIVPVTTTMNHPQWWRRFKNKEGADFSQRAWFNTIRRF